MDLHNVHTLYESLVGDKPAFLFSGEFNDEHSARLIKLGEEMLESEDAPRNLRGRLAFVLVEAYRDSAAAARHKETAHYAEWRDRVAEMMAAPRTSIKYRNLAPDDNGWDSFGG